MLLPSAHQHMQLRGVGRRPSGVLGWLGHVIAPRPNPSKPI